MQSHPPRRQNVIISLKGFPSSRSSRFIWNVTKYHGTRQNVTISPKEIPRVRSSHIAWSHGKSSRFIWNVTISLKGFPKARSSHSGGFTPLIPWWRHTTWSSMGFGLTYIFLWGAPTCTRHYLICERFLNVGHRLVHCTWGVYSNILALFLHP